MSLSAFFPQDSRSSELASAWGLLFLSILCVLSEYIGLDDNVLKMAQSMPFWMVVTFALGFVQLLSVALYPKVELLRTIIAWANGSLWIWIGFSSSYAHIAISDIAAICLGFSNLYAFALNSFTIRNHWEL